MENHKVGLRVSAAVFVYLVGAILVARTDAGEMRQVWTAWSSWTECSFTCGQGVQSRYRECVGHTAGGLVRLERPSCRGNSKEYRICKRPPCAPDAEGKREVQCSGHNKDIVVGNVYHWVPFYGGLNPCELTCLARGYSFYYNFGNVKDGTKCKHDGEDLCVGGRCMAVGCDNYVGSRAKVDKCKVCGGRNANCAYYQKTYKRPLPKSGEFGYNEVVKIPTGATHLEIHDRSNNYLALADSRMTYIINGNWVIDWPGRYEVAGTTIYYSRTGSDNETITAYGPIKEDLHLMLIFRERNPGVDYQFWLPREKLSDIEGDEYLPGVFGGSHHVHRTAYGNLPDSQQRGKSKEPIGSELPTHGGDRSSKRGARPVKPGHSNKRRPWKSQNGLSKNDDNPTVSTNYEHSIDGFNRKRHGFPAGSRGASGTSDDAKRPNHALGGSANIWWDPRKRRRQNKQFDFPVDVSHIGPQLDDRSHPGLSDNIANGIATTSRPRPTQAATESPPTKRPKHKAHKNKKKGTKRATVKNVNSVIPNKHSCGPCPKKKDRVKHFCKSDFVVHLVVLSEQHPGTGNDTRYDVRVLHRYKDTVSLLGREYVWVPNRCRCPRLSRTREYIVMGTLATNRPTRESRLQLDADSYVRVYNVANANRMRTRIPRAKCEKYV